MEYGVVGLGSSRKLKIRCKLIYLSPIELENLSDGCPLGTITYSDKSDFFSILLPPQRH